MDDIVSVSRGGLPQAFLNRMQELLTENEYTAFLSSYGQKRFYSLRVNTLKTDRERALRLLDQAVSAESDIVPGSGSALQQRSLQPVEE